MESLTHEQIAYIERHGKTKNPKTLAKDLKLELRTVQTALKALNDPTKRVPVVAPTTRRTTNDALISVAFLLAILALGWLAYENNLRDAWHFDDNHAVLGNSAIHEPSVEAIYKSNRYRMALYWVFAGSWGLHGPDVKGWHIENNLIHVLNGFLVYALVLLTLRTPAAEKQSRWPQLVAGIAGLIFVLHPVQTQAVTYITQRTESLCATFYLLALVLYAWARVRRIQGKAQGTEAWASLPLAAGVSVAILAVTFLGLAGKVGPFVVLSGLGALGAVGAVVYSVTQKKADPIEGALLAGTLLATLVACETKEIAGTIPAALLLWEVVFMRPRAESSLVDRAKAHAAVAPWAAMLVFLPILAVAAGLDARLRLREGIEDQLYDIREVTGKQYFLTELNVLATYVRLYLLPYAQSLDYDYVKRTGLFDGPTLLSLLGLLSVVALAVKVRRTQPVFTFSVFFMLAVLAPTSVFALPDFIFEHRIYLPVAAAAFVTALLAERVIRAAVKDERAARRVLVGAFVPVLAIFVVLTRMRNEVWATDETLWSDSHERAPEKPRPLTNLGLYYQCVENQRVWLKDGTFVGGTFIDGAQLGDPTVWIGRSIFQGAKDFKVSKALVARGPEKWGGLERAEEIYQDALKLDPDYYKARNNYALCEVQLGINDIKNAQQALRFVNDPRVAEKARETVDRFEKSALNHFAIGERELREIIRRHPDDNVSLMNLGNLYFGYLDRLDEAAQCVQKSIDLDDHQPVVYAVLGEIFFSRALDEYDAGKASEAAADYKRAVSSYTTFLERAGDDSKRKHIMDRKQRAERAIIDGTRAEPKADPSQMPVDPFDQSQGLQEGRGARWHPPRKDK